MLPSHCRNAERFSAEAQGSASVARRHLSGWQSAVREIESWPEYKAQPLRELRDLAAAAGVESVFYQDESRRFGPQMGSFKALGAPYAIYRLLARAVAERLGIPAPTAAELRAGKYRDITGRIVVTVATDGNQGRGLAYGARIFGCRAVVYVHSHVSAARREAMEALGAIVIRVDGEYEASVARAREDARMNGWHFVSSTSWDDYQSEVARDVMLGYQVMVREAARGFPENQRPTHVFVHGGVGSIVAAVFLGLYEEGWRSRFIAVEPAEADCLFQSALHRKPTPATGSLRTVMAGLACREVSPAAWKLLQWLASDFVAVQDDWAIQGMRTLAQGSPPVVCGESSAAAAGLLLLAAEPLRRALDLGPESRVLIFGCEGATDPQAYQQIVGESAEAVFLRQNQ